MFSRSTKRRISCGVVVANLRDPIVRAMLDDMTEEIRSVRRRSPSNGPDYWVATGLTEVLFRVTTDGRWDTMRTVQAYEQQLSRTRALVRFYRACARLQFELDWRRALFQFGVEFADSTGGRLFAENDGRP